MPTVNTIAKEPAPSENRSSTRTSLSRRRKQPPKRLITLLFCLGWTGAGISLPLMAWGVWMYDRRYTLRPLYAGAGFLIAGGLLFGIGALVKHLTNPQRHHRSRHDSKAVVTHRKRRRRVRIKREP